MTYNQNKVTFPKGGCACGAVGNLTNRANVYQTNIKKYGQQSQFYQRRKTIKERFLK